MAKQPIKTAGAVGQNDEPANLGPATDFEASGAIIEPAIVGGVDMKHPAVDSNPREHTTVDMNRIDFNDPTKDQEEAVIDNLEENGFDKSAKEPTREERRAATKRRT